MWLLYAALGLLLLLAVVAVVIVWALRTPPGSEGRHASRTYRHWAAGLTVAGVLLNVVSWATGPLALSAPAGLLFFAGIIMVLFAGLRRVLFLTIAKAR